MYYVDFILSEVNDRGKIFPWFKTEEDLRKFRPWMDEFIIGDLIDVWEKERKRAGGSQGFSREMISIME